MEVEHQLKEDLGSSGNNFKNTQNKRSSLYANATVLVKKKNCATEEVIFVQVLP